MNQALELIDRAGEWTLSRRFRVLIIGAGVGGLAMAHRLKLAGVKDVVIYEKAQSVGGTWRENTYPGITCDVPAPLYSFTFFPNMQWTQSSAPGAEIHAYLDRMADELDLRRHIMFGKRVTRCDYQDAGWAVETDDGGIATADILISASGFLHLPSIPSFPGMETFDGEIFHSAEWNHDVPLEGKRVGVIGTGSTSTQIVSALVDRVGTLELFQRTPQWVYPFPNSIYSDAERAEWQKSPAIIRETYDRLLTELNTVYGDVAAGSEEAARILSEACTEYLATVKDPDLRARLTPEDPFGCKRLIMSTTFYEAIQRDNAALVTEAIEAFEPAGIRTADGILHKLDAVVMATGYRSHEFCKALNVTGERGRKLDDEWIDGASSFQSVTIAGFPNFFMIGGPFSPFGNQSYMTGAELQTIYIIRLMRILEENDVDALVPTDEAEEKFRAENRAGAIGKRWLAGCKSWFLDAKGNLPLWTRRPEQFIDMMDKGPQRPDYRLIRRSDRQACDAEQAVVNG